MPVCRAVPLAELAPEQRPPEGICRLHAKFWACAVCGKAYWKVCTLIDINDGAKASWAQPGCMHIRCRNMLHDNHIFRCSEALVGNVTACLAVCSVRLLC